MNIRELKRRAHVDHWLKSGGVVLTSSERTARAVIAAFVEARVLEGRSAWETPAIFAWENWVRKEWAAHEVSGLMLLNPLQEQAIWTKVIGRSRMGEGLLHTTRLAKTALQAYRLLADFAPAGLQASARAGWTGDPATFSEWLGAFKTGCRRESVISPSQAGLALTEMLRRRATEIRPALLLVGFDRIRRPQRELLDVWGLWEAYSDEELDQETATEPRFYSAKDSATELADCVSWLRERLAGDAKKHLLIVVPGLSNRRGELERALLAATGSNVGGSPWSFEFSLGVPLGQIGVARSALLLLRWLKQSVAEAEVDWLLTSGHCATGPGEEIALAEAMRAIRRDGLERPQWQLGDFLQARRGNGRSERARLLPESWFVRMKAASRILERAEARQSPMDWTAIAGNVLEGMGWPGSRPETSLAFQARKRWEKALESCASLGFDGSQMDWAEFVSALGDAVSETIFAAESTGASVQITEPLESAGQLADGVWFLGADEEAWPGRGTPHPFLPLSLQREAEMPHASMEADWALAQQATHRLMRSADQVIFSYARLVGESEVRPSRLCMLECGIPKEMPHWLAHRSGLATALLTETFEDGSIVPLTLNKIQGGAATLTRQSLCPFQAFGTARLGAESWQAAETGLNARQRGQLLHGVLALVWAGTERGGISTSGELAAIGDLRAFAAGRVERAMREMFDPERRNALPDRFPAPFLDLEAERLTRLVTQWLEYERQRVPFTVAETESTRNVVIAGHELTLRIDRVDQGTDGKLILDYKSSNVGPSAWAGERPEDVQLPLYASWALDEDVEGLLFARIRAGEKMTFCGRVRHATATLLSGLTNMNGLVRNPLDDEQLYGWRLLIEKLAEDFVAGRAEVDPLDVAKTCKRCDLKTVCRIYENRPDAVGLEAEDTPIEGESGASDE